MSALEQALIGLEGCDCVPILPLKTSFASFIALNNSSVLQTAVPNSWLRNFLIGLTSLEVIIPTAAFGPMLAFISGLVGGPFRRSQPSLWSLGDPSMAGTPEYLAFIPCRIFSCSSGMYGLALLSCEKIRVSNFRAYVFFSDRILVISFA